MSCSKGSSKSSKGGAVKKTSSKFHMIQMTSRKYALFDILKHDGEFFFAVYNPKDPANPVILKPRGGPPPPSAEGFSFFSIMKKIPPDVMKKMVYEFLVIFGQFGHEPYIEGPQSCSIKDYPDIEDLIRYYEVD